MRDEFAEAVTAKVEALRLGHGLDAGTDIGPLAADRFRDKVDRSRRGRRRRGARVLTGGGRPDRPGYFYEPTVLVDVDDDMVIMPRRPSGRRSRSRPTTTFDEVIDRVNASEMGLGATLRSSDPLLIKRFYEGVKAGTVWINDPLTDNYAGPFGGMKMTGGGRELGPEGSRPSSRPSTCTGTSARSGKDWWFPYGDESSA
jgi:acyl-CoA reductase-like NAD-dependent aldehyde dehydrogenase